MLLTCTKASDRELRIGRAYDGEILRKSFRIYSTDNVYPLSYFTCETSITFYRDGYVLEGTSGLSYYKFSNVDSLSSNNFYYDKISTKFKEWLDNDDV